MERLSMSSYTGVINF